MKLSKLLKLFCLLIIASLTSCKDDEVETVDSVKKYSKTDVIDNYANIVYTSYTDAIDDATALKDKIDVFVASPTEQKFNACKTAWLKARESYGPTEAYRFAGGPIDDADGPEGLLNAWPLDENYIDYVEGNTTSGIINDLVQFPTIDKTTLEGLNEVGGEANISVGYHAIEFLLWGQDLTDPEDKKAGVRPYTDFVDAGTASNQDRRRDYLVACAELLVDHLQLMIDEWKDGGSYRSQFLAADENEILSGIFTAIATLSKSELAGERIFVAYDNQDQEDEHSCFSDNTHRDVRLNLEGIANVYRGSYGDIEGASLEDLITQEDPVLGAEISGQLAIAELAVENTAVPFDFAISNSVERPKVLLSVNELQTLGDKFVKGASALNLSIVAE